MTNWPMNFVFFLSGSWHFALNIPKMHLPRAKSERYFIMWSRFWSYETWRWFCQPCRMEMNEILNKTMHSPMCLFSLWTQENQGIQYFWAVMLLLHLQKVLWLLPSLTLLFMHILALGNAFFFFFLWCSSGFNRAVDNLLGVFWQWEENVS